MSAETSDQEYFGNTRPEMLSFIPANLNRVLEIGCGRGVFMSSLKRRSDFEAWGIELDDVSAKAAESHFDKTMSGGVEECLERVPDGYFDCVICNDVLEHLVDPYSVLDTISEKLAAKGTLVCSIPNVRHFRNLYDLVVNGDWEYKDSGVMDRTHLRFFTKKSINSMFIKHGYNVLTLEGINETPNTAVKILSVLSFGFFEDTRYLQYACVAQPS